MSQTKPRSPFDEYGMENVVSQLIEEIIELYLADSTPWVIGYSGGKDSSATLQLVWAALEKLGSARAKKPVHVISTDTLVENPVVAAWVASSLDKINVKGKTLGLPITAHRLTPELSDSFWVNLIGKGYPAPRQKFRWCTERLKIKPANKFISSMVDQHGETILVLGIRKTESVARARTMEKHEEYRIRDRLSPNASLPNSLIYSPIEDWSNDDVWMFLLETQNPWGHDNTDLFELYRGATSDGECPLVVSTNTPSCGDSRFGCWVCTLVEKDKSMQAMIRNNEDKQWMYPLLQIRNEIDFRNMSEDGDRHLRDFRRMSGNTQLFHGRLVHGPYKQEMREKLLFKLLSTQSLVRKTGPKHVCNLELIRLDELEEIRRIWVVEKHELEDSLPKLYEKATDMIYPGRKLSDSAPFGAREMAVLKKACGENHLHFEMMRELLSIGKKQKNALRRAKIYSSLENAIRRNYYDDEKDAIAFAKMKKGEDEQEAPPSASISKKTLWLLPDDNR